MSTRLGAFLIARHATFDDLASLTGLSVRTLHNVSCEANQCKKTRGKIEAALGFVIWPSKRASLDANRADESPNLPLSHE